MPMRVQRSASRHGGAAEEPRDRDPHGDADPDRDPRVQEAVEDVLRRLHDHALVVLDGVGHGQRRERPPLAHGRQRHADVRDEGEEQHEGEECHRDRLPGRREPAPGDLRVGERRVILEPHVVAGRQQEEHRQEHHERRDDDAHAEDALVHELDDVEVGLRRQQVLHPEHQRRREVREGPDEDQQRPGDVARRRQRQGHRPELPPAPGAHALGRLLQRRVDLAEGVHDVERDHGEEVEGLHQHHPVDPIDEVDGPEHVEPVHQEHVHGPRPAQDEGEAQHPHQRRRDDRDDGEVTEEVPPPEVEADEEEGDGDAERGGGDDGHHAQDQGVPERAPVELVGEEVLEIRQREAAGPVRHGVVEDPAQRVDEKEDQECPDQPHAQEEREAGTTHRRPPPA